MAERCTEFLDPEWLAGVPIRCKREKGHVEKGAICHTYRTPNGSLLMWTQALRRPEQSADEVLASV